MSKRSFSSLLKDRARSNSSVDTTANDNSKNDSPNPKPHPTSTPGEESRCVSVFGVPGDIGNSELIQHLLRKWRVEKVTKRYQSGFVSDYFQQRNFKRKPSGKAEIRFVTPEQARSFRKELIRARSIKIEVEGDNYTGIYYLYSRYSAPGEVQQIPKGQEHAHEFEFNTTTNTNKNMKTSTSSNTNPNINPPPGNTAKDVEKQEDPRTPLERYWDGIEKHAFPVLSFCFYARDNHYYPCEMTVSKFTLNTGELTGTWSTEVWSIPSGPDEETIREKFGLESEDFPMEAKESVASHAKKLWKAIKVRKREVNGVKAFFSDDVTKPMEDCLNWIASTAGVANDFCVIPIDELFKKIYAEGKKASGGVTTDMFDKAYEEVVMTKRHVDCDTLEGKCKLHVSRSEERMSSFECSKQKASLHCARACKIAYITGIITRPQSRLLEAWGKGEALIAKKREQEQAKRMESEREGFCYDISTGAAQDPYYDPANWYATDTNTTAFPSTNPSVPLSNPGVIRGLMEIAGSEHLDKLLLLIKYYEQVVEKLASQTIQLQWQFQRDNEGLRNEVCRLSNRLAEREQQMAGLNAEIRRLLVMVRLGDETRNTEKEQYKIKETELKAYINTLDVRHSREKSDMIDRTYLTGRANLLGNNLRFKKLEAVHAKKVQELEDKIRELSMNGSRESRANSSEEAHDNLDAGLHKDNELSSLDLNSEPKNDYAYDDSEDDHLEDQITDPRRLRELIIDLKQNNKQLKYKNQILVESQENPRVVTAQEELKEMYAIVKQLGLDDLRIPDLRRKCPNLDKLTLEIPNTVLPALYSYDKSGRRRKNFNLHDIEKLKLSKNSLPEAFEPIKEYLKNPLRRKTWVEARIIPDNDPRVHLRGQYGVFAREEIPPLTVLCQYIGKLTESDTAHKSSCTICYLKDKEAYYYGVESLSMEFKLLQTYRTESETSGNERYVIDGFGYGNVSLLINDPMFLENGVLNVRKQNEYGYHQNCQFVEVYSKWKMGKKNIQWPMVFLLTTEEIRKDQEVLVSYGPEYWESQVKDKTKLRQAMEDFLAKIKGYVSEEPIPIMVKEEVIDVRLNTGVHHGVLR